MPVQAKASLAAMLLDDLASSAQGGKTTSKDDKDSSDFGAALSSLVSNPFVMPPAKAGNKSGNSSDESGAIAGANSNQKTSLAIPSPLLGGGNDAETVFAAWISSASAQSPATASADKTANAGQSTDAKPAPSTTAQVATAQAPAGVNLAAIANAIESAANLSAELLKSAPLRLLAEGAAPRASIKITSSSPTNRDLQDAQAGNAAAPDANASITPVSQSVSTSPQKDASAAPAEDSANRSALTATTSTQDPTSGSQPGQNALGSNNPSPAEAQKTQDIPAQPLAARAASAYEAQAASEKPSERDRTLLERESAIAGDSTLAGQIGSSNNDGAQKVTEAAQIRQVLDAVSNAPAARVANVKIDLTEGQAAQAIVRERGGNVEVKIIAPGAESARHISGEVDGLRSALEGAGLHLAQAEVSYQSGSGHSSQRESGENGRNPGGQQSNSKEIFALDEVSQ